MKRIAVVSILVLVLAVLFNAPAYAFFINFEDGTDGAPVNNITGVSFQSFNGFTSIYSDLRTGVYNGTSDDLGYSTGTGAYHLNGNFSMWAGPDAAATGVKVDFTNNDGTFFTTGYSSASNFYVDAFFTDGSMSEIIGASNLNSPMGHLSIFAGAGQFIDYLVLHDTGNFWIVDDMSGDATGVNSVPEPVSILLFGAGLFGVGIFRKKIMG